MMAYIHIMECKGQYFIHVVCYMQGWTKGQASWAAARAADLQVVLRHQ